MDTDTSQDHKSGRLEKTMQLVREREQNSKVEFAQLKRDALLALRDDLNDVIQDIPYDAHFFDFRISGKEPARLWVDATTFITLADETGNFLMLKETRAGRVLLCESDDRKSVGDAAIQYIAERLAEWEHSKSTRDKASMPKSQQPISPSNDLQTDKIFADTKIFELAVSEPTHVHTARVIKSKPLDEHDDLDADDESFNQQDTPIVVVKPSPLRNFICFVIGAVFGALGLLIYAWNREAITSFVMNTIDWVQSLT